MGRQKDNYKFVFIISFGRVMLKSDVNRIRCIRPELSQNVNYFVNFQSIYLKFYTRNISAYSNDTFSIEIFNVAMNKIFLVNSAVLFLEQNFKITPLLIYKVLLKSNEIFQFRGFYDINSIFKKSPFINFV